MKKITNVKQVIFLVILSLYVYWSPHISANEKIPVNRLEIHGDPETKEAFEKVASSISNEHPRVFINPKSLEDIRSKAKREHHNHFLKTKEKIDEWMTKEIVFKDSTVMDGSQSKDHEYGFIAADAAFLYLILNDTTYLNYTKHVLRNLTDYYEDRNRRKASVHWYAYSRICALSAFDWIFTDLSPQERLDIGRPLLRAIHTMIPDGVRERFFRENTGNYKTGFYGTPSLSWYAGLVFYKSGIDDELAASLLEKGFVDHWKLLGYRNSLAGDDGGAASAVIEYASETYPWTEFNFFHTVRSATGINIAEQWKHPVDFLYWLNWNWLPGNHQFGYGDASHFTNKLVLKHMHRHLGQIENFYGGSDPEILPWISWIRKRVKQYDIDVIPFTRYLLKTSDAADDRLPETPSAMHFENMGQIFMRSGLSTNDTYALFTAGGILKNHKHYDNNNFVIYRNGFRALDSGTRPEPGQHLTHYYSRTVAHNCILIRMPGEEFPKYWGGPAKSETPMPVPNDGGQRELLGSVVTGYGHNEHYVYIASDATKSYHEDKAEEVIRQLVFIKPDIFVVYDRIVAKSKDYTKTWLLHTVAEPKFKNGNEFSETSQEGKLFCRLVFPVDGQMSKIGGAGKQFWSDGQNWPLPVLTPEDWNYARSKHKIPLDTIPFLGQWRVEVTPKTPSRRNNFLHLIQVGDKELHDMVSSRPVITDHAEGVELDYDGKTFKVMFSKEGDIGGDIHISRKGTTIRQQKFTTAVTSQKSIFHKTEK